MASKTTLCYIVLDSKGRALQRYMGHSYWVTLSFASDYDKAIKFYLPSTAAQYADEWG
jgi:hypothetical protein